jgi:hypothetical protein
MPELLVVGANPRRKKRRKLSAKQIAAGFGGGGGKKRRRGRKRSRSVALSSSRPARRRGRSRSRGRSMNVGASLSRLSVGGIVNETLIPAAIGAAGALATDYALNAVSSQLPAFLQTGPARVGVKLAAALGLGYLVSMIGGRRLGAQALAGAAVVTAYDFLKPYAAAALPGVAGYNDGMGYWSPALQLPFPYTDSGNPAVQIDGFSAYVDPAGMGAYVDPSMYG